MPDRTVILGPPGTGKTTYLTRQVARAVESFGPDRVVVASLTRTAAAKIAASITKADVEADLEHVGTLHALCFRALGRPKLVYTTLKDFNAQYRTELGGRKDVDDLDDDPGQSEDDRILAELDLLRARRVPRMLWPHHVERFASRWESWKAATGTMDFTDLVETALRELPDGIVQGGVLLGDEAQDWSQLELDLVKSWSAHCDHAVIAGDDDQSLYQWRGASVEGFLGWADRKIVLSQSYRVPRAVWQAAQTWSSQIHTRQEKAYRSRIDPETLEYPEGALRELPTPYRFAEDLVPELLADLSRGREVMVLASCGYMIEAVLGALRRECVPFHNPYRRKNATWNPLHIAKRRASPAGRLLDLSRMDPHTWGAEARPWTWQEVSRWADTLDRRSLVHGAKTRIEERKADLRPVSFDELEALIQPQALAPLISCDLSWYLEHASSARVKPLVYPVAVARRHGVKALAEQPKLVVGTIHSVKGGEADVVYLFPDLSPAGFEDLESGPDGHDGVMRAFYVGITRAREELVLCAPSSGLAVEWWPARRAVDERRSA